MLDRPFQHVADRDQEGQKHKGKQRQHQKKGTTPGAGLGCGQRGLQRASIGGGKKV